MNDQLQSSTESIHGRQEMDLSENTNTFTNLIGEKILYTTIQKVFKRIFYKVKKYVNYSLKLTCMYRILFKNVHKLLTL